MTGLHLVLLAVVVATVGPRLLRRATWVYRSPGLGILAWYALLGTVALALVAAVLSWLVPGQSGHWAWSGSWRWCVDAARGVFGVAWRIVLIVLLIGLTVLGVRIAVATGRLAAAAAARRRRHRQLLSLAGQRDPALDATVVHDAHPAAYTLAGHDRRIVVTTGALDVLTGDELAAVLAHERAHARGRHDLLVDGVRLLAVAEPRVLLFTAARVQLGRLVEIRADDIAVAGHARISLARALVALACAAATGTPAAAPGRLAAPDPVGALAAMGGDAAVRLRRLLTPPVPLGVGYRAAISAGVLALAATPAAVLVATHYLPVLDMCPACWV